MTGSGNFSLDPSAAGRAQHIPNEPKTSASRGKAAVRLERQGASSGRQVARYRAHKLETPRPPFDTRAGRTNPAPRSEEPTPELQSLMRISTAEYCLNKKK